MSSSRWAATPIGRLVIAAAIVGLAGGVTACDAGNNAPTLEFHPQSDGGTTKTPDDVVTVTLATHAIS